ncbi:hypothetical protein ACOK4R_23780 [Pseudomonas fluorescens]
MSYFLFDKSWLACDADTLVCQATELMPSQASQLPPLTEYGFAVAVAVAVALALTSFSMTKSAVF